MPVKPNTRSAMSMLIAQIRTQIPFDLPIEKLCNGPCTGCSKKLLEYLEMELEGQEYKLAKGETPGLGDINKLARTAQKIHNILARNQLLDKDSQ